MGGQSPWAGSSPTRRAKLGCQALALWLPLAVCPQADGARGVGLGGRGGGGAQLLQQHPGEGATPGRAGGLQARPHAALRPRGPGPGQPRWARGEGRPRGGLLSLSFCSCPPPSSRRVPPPRPSFLPQTAQSYVAHSRQFRRDSHPQTLSKNHPSGLLGAMKGLPREVTTNSAGRLSVVRRTSLRRWCRAGP